MAKIQFENKVALNENASIPDINKCKATDMNEIKSVVNKNDDLVGNLSTLNTTDKSSIVGAINEVYQSNIYSTEETIIGKYFNKTHYRKLLVIENPKVGNTAINHGIDNLEKITLMYGNMSVQNGRTQCIPRVVPDAIANYGLGYGDISSTQFTLQIGGGYVSSLTPKKIELIIEYTKTTD